MSSILGNLFLLIACVLTSTYIFTPFFSIPSRALNAITFLCVTFALSILLYCHITDNFSLYNVYYNSHTTKPLLYKISGIWGNMEGSMLLWCWVLTLYLLLLELSLNNNQSKKISLIVQNLICFGFLSFTLFSLDPFAQIQPTASNGLGFNPILQDIGLVIHPPILYLGYLGFSAVFSLSIAGLIAKVEGNKWANIVRPWILISWSFLTLGIGLGSWWAYRELGWGGFWFWDPVENVSLMPWLIATALLHLILIVKKFNLLRNFAILLSIMTFISSTMGTFLVRSGILISVHAFANNPKQGLCILALSYLIVTSSLITFILFANKVKKSSHQFPFISRFTSILLNNLLFITAFTVVCIGTLYPIILEYLTDEVISVGAPYYNLLFNSIALGVLILTIIGPYLSWNGSKLISIFSKYKFSFFLALLTIPFIFKKGVMATTAITLAVALFVSILESYSKRTKLFSLPLLESIALAKGISKTYYAMMISHIGVAVLVLGVATAANWQEENESYMRIGESISINKYKISLINAEFIKDKNFSAVKGSFVIQNLSNKLLTPENRFYPIEKQKKIKSDIYHHPLFDIHVTIGDIDKDKGIATRVYYRPGVIAIWLGCIAIALGAAVSVFGILTKSKN
ncbi:heme lyase CcmF/NrfE family subunit [Candidatus Mesenet endosymbiont of Agriotes lineatus]|uniref:heme lyase CcmF/NrfE family subunit n=1 Tax=Candidatus Mesenet endosymbiont of Agriotes lineatus TaxID=3077948 RepID=UPI0030CE8449